MPPPRRSRPAQKKRPEPVMTTARISSSPLASTSRSVKASSMGPEMVFCRSGRLNVMVAM